MTSIIKESKLRLMKNKIKSVVTNQLKENPSKKEALRQKIQKAGSFSASDFCIDYFTIFSQKFMSMVAASALVALPCGINVLSSIPPMIPAFTAQAMAGLA